MKDKINNLMESEINESKSYIEVLNKRIEFYQNKIKNLSKPLIFGKAKYNKELDRYNQKIGSAYVQIGIEEEMIMKLEKNIDLK